MFNPFSAIIDALRRARAAKAVAAYLDALKAHMSTCCNAPLDLSEVITVGPFAGRGPRRCSQCRKIVYQK